MNKIGAHYSIAVKSGGFLGAFQAARSDKATALQIFTKSPRSSQLREITQKEASEIASSKESKDISYRVIHASYLLNLAKPLSPDAYELRSLTEDLRSAEKIDGAGVVLHIGKTLKSDPKEAFDLFVENVSKALEETKGLKANVILENTAGQGTEMGFRFDELGRIYKAIKKTTTEATRLSICFDTQHAFAAGYDLSNQAGVEKTLDEFEEHLSLNSLNVVHLNDSKKVCGARVDRHQDIGKGEIGAEGLEAFVKELNKRLVKAPLILETPQEFNPWNKQIAEVGSWL